MKAITKTEKPTQPVAEAVTYITPAVDVLETKEAYILEADLPGVNKEGLEILLEGNELTILGHRSITGPQVEVVYRESRPADYMRIFELDPAVDTEKIDAKVEQGVLVLNLPKCENVKPRKIAVTD